MTVYVRHKDGHKYYDTAMFKGVTSVYSMGRWLCIQTGETIAQFRIKNVLWYKEIR